MEVSLCILTNKWSSVDDSCDELIYTHHVRVQTHSNRDNFRIDFEGRAAVVSGIPDGLWAFFPMPAFRFGYSADAEDRRGWICQLFEHRPMVRALELDWICGEKNGKWVRIVRII